MGQADAGEAFADPEVEVIHGAGTNADQDLILARLGIGDVFVLQDFGAAECVDTDCLHDVSQASTGLTSIWRGGDNPDMDGFDYGYL